MELSGDWIICSECKSEIGYVYYANHKWNVFVFAPYKRFTYQINKWAAKHTKDRIAEDVAEQEWSILINNIRKSKEEIVCEFCDRTDGINYNFNELIAI